MIILISPAKTLDFESKVQTLEETEPFFIQQADQIASEMKKKDAAEIAELMSLSTQLARLNFERYQQWFEESTATRQALLAFKGDVYLGLEANKLSESDIDFGQKHLRILSGMYGILRPLDSIKPYRLEMGARLSFGEFQDLYSFWKPKITSHLNDQLNSLKNRIIINLASKEYASAVDFKVLSSNVISPEFKDYKNGEYKIISFFAKKARGRMTRFILKNGIENPEDLNAFSEDGYIYNAKLSKPGKPVFTRN